jgi:lipopolysaccharide export system protein LptA
MKSLLPLALVLALPFAGPAAAQLATNSNAPIRADSDDLKTDNNNCVATYTGNVEALQDDAHLRADVLKVFTEVAAKGSKPAAPAKDGGTGTASSCGNLKRIEAHGSVYYANPRERVHGDDAFWEAGSDTLTVTGSNVVAVQNRNVLRGTRMVMNNQTGEGHMVGATTGANKTNRVATVIYPRDNDQNAQGTGAQGTTGAQGGAATKDASQPAKPKKKKSSQ